MTFNFEELKKLGSKKIHADTHIIKPHIEAILSEDFEAINKVQLFGFLSIIEREYDLDLSIVRENAKEFYDAELANATEETGIFIVADQNKTHSILYIFIILFIVIAVAIFTINRDSDNTIFVDSENKIIKEVQKNIELSKEEKSEKNEVLEETTIENKTVVNLSQKETITTPIEKVSPPKEVTIDLKVEKIQKKEAIVQTKKIVQEQQGLVESLVLLPKIKVWIGYINVTDNIKNQKVFSDELFLNPDKEWLIIVGHRDVDIEVDGHKFKYKNLRFNYKNGKIKEVTLEEFKQINRGKKW